MKKIKLSKKNYFVIAISFIILLAVFGTLAWWQWSSEINALIYGEVCAPEIVFMGGTTINGGDLLPVLTKEEGLTKDIYVNLNNTCANDTAVLNLNLNLELFPSGLADSSFKWALYEVEFSTVGGTPTETLTYVNNGNFANKVQNNTMILAEDLLVTENVSTYRLFIWIDANMDNPSTVGDNVFKFKLYGTGSGAIYNEYTMKQVSNSSATGSFWGSSINANQVKSIRFIPTDQIPSVYTGTYDLSSVVDSNDVTMYYVENGQTNDATPITLYDVYVASNNGMSKIHTNTSTEKMFAYLSNCEYIDAEGLDTSNSISMQYMFYNCGSLTTLKISNFNTSNVTSMRAMFAGCSSLTSVDLSSFNTSNVTYMTSMFSRCSSLTSLNLSNFNTSGVTGMAGMFDSCSSLTSVDLSNFNTSNVTSMSSMFFDCSSLTSLNLRSFNTSSVTFMANMFFNCSSLTNLNLSNFNTSSVSIMSQMFENCSSLTSLDLSSFDTTSVINMQGMFNSCSSLTSLDLSNFNTSNVRYMDRMFSGCSGLTSLDLSNFNTSSVTTMATMFYDCSGLTSLDLSSFDFTSVTDYSSTFTSVPSTTTIYIDCTQESAFVSKFGNRDGLTIVNNEACNV